MRIINAGAHEQLGPYDAPDGLPADPTSLVAEMAVTTGDLAAGTTWRAAEWDDDGKVVSTGTFGSIGSGADVELAGGVWRVWVRVTDDPDQPVARVDTLDVRGLSGDTDPEDLGLATDDEVEAAVAAHDTDAGAHGGIVAGAHPDLATHDALGLATQAELDAHTADTTAVHGIADTAVLETVTGAQAKADAAEAAAGVYTDGEVSDEATARSAADALLVPLSQKGAADGVATLGADSKIPSAQIPAIALSEFLGTVASEAAMLALVGQRGDWAVRTDFDPDRVFILETDDPSQAANWTDVTTPGAVVSVNGDTGAVSLAAADIPFTPTGALAADDVQEALTELDNEKAGTGHNHAAVTVDFSGNVNTARPDTLSPVIWIGGSSTPTNVDYTKSDIVVDASNGNVTLDGGTPSTPGDVLQIRRGTAAAWSSANPTPPAGVLCFETDTRVLKIGDGSTAYNSLTAVNDGSGSGVAVEDEGVEELAAATRLNFEGAGVSVADAGSGEATITIPGASGTTDLFVRKTADTPTRALNTTLSDDNELTLAVAANKIYQFTCVLVYLGDDGGDLKVQFNGPAGATLAATALRLQDTATTATTSAIWNSITLGSSRAMGAIDAVNVVALFQGLLRTGGTAGNFTLQWAQNASHATGTTILTDSFIKLQEIA